jgi:hypothetical protein
VKKEQNEGIAPPARRFSRKFYDIVVIAGVFLTILLTNIATRRAAVRQPRESVRADSLYPTPASGLDGASAMYLRCSAPERM